MNNAPTSTPLFGPMLLDYWNQKYEEAGRDKRPMSIEGARFRHSWAGMCARRIQYEIQRHEDIREFDIAVEPAADRWRMEMGTLVHDYWQAALQHCLPDATIEHVTGFEFDTYSTAGHGDALIRHPKLGTVCVELKTRNGFGYKQDIGANKSLVPEGPSHNAKIQGALNALHEDADLLVILHISLEAIGPNQMPPDKKDKYNPMRITAEWWYTPEEYEPWARHELLRAKHIVEMTDKNVLAPRSVPEIMPKGARIVDPVKSEWILFDDDNVAVQRGLLWNQRYCTYCKFQDVCLSDGPGEV